MVCKQAWSIKIIDTFETYRTTMDLALSPLTYHDNVAVYEVEHNAYHSDAQKYTTMPPLLKVASTMNDEQDDQEDKRDSERYNTPK
jgi:hypothetical protein